MDAPIVNATVTIDGKTVVQDREADALRSGQLNLTHYPEDR